MQKTVGAGVRQHFFAEDGTSLFGECSVQGGNASSLVEVVYLGNTPVLAPAGGQVYSIQADHLNAPRTIKNSAGAVVWRWQSDAFGVGQADSNPSGLFAFEFNLRFPGQLFDAETGLHYNNARYYDPATGRHISSDPIGLAGGINTYGYVGQAPTGAVDPEGLDAWYLDRTLTAPAESAVEAMRWVRYIQAQSDDEQDAWTTSKYLRAKRFGSWASDMNLRNAEHYLFAQHAKKKFCETMPEPLSEAALLYGVGAWSLFKGARHAWAPGSTTSPSLEEPAAGVAGTLAPAYTYPAKPISGRTLPRPFVQ